MNRIDMGYRLTLLVCFCVAGLAKADNWPEWRGPNGNGISEETGLPTKWNGTDDAAWRAPLPGPAGSTPVIWGDRIYLTTSDGDALALMGLDTSGKVLWKESITGGNVTVRGDEGNYASPTPSTDGKHVWAMFGDGVLTCRTPDGAEVWTVDLQERYGKFDIQFGMTSTPVLEDGKLYVMCMYTGNSYIACLDAKTGKELWKHQRVSDATAECEHSYASPVLYRGEAATLLLAHGADYVTAHRLSDGEEVFRCGGLNGRGIAYNPTLRFVASPVAAEGLIVVPSAKKGPILGLKPDAEGDITDTSAKKAGHAWRINNNTPDVPSPLIHDGLVYLCGERGVLTCVDASTGERIYQERLEPARFRASPIYGDGKVYLVSRKGTIHVVKAGRDFELLAANKMNEEMSASLAIAGGRVYVRTFDALYSIGD